MKMTVKSKELPRHKPGELVRTVIEYGPGKDGGASVEHHHEPMPPKRGEMFSNSAFAPPAKKHFGTRAEAHHNAAKHAGVVLNMTDHPEPDDIGEEENEEAGAGVGDLSSKKPKPKMPRQPMTMGGGIAGKSGLPNQQ